MGVNQASVPAAVQAFVAALGEQAVAHDDPALTRREANTMGWSTRAVAVLSPTSTSQIREIVGIANRFQVPLYPVSTGRNWGYGSANAPRAGCAIVELSRMNRIVEFDEELGTVTLEPGVTQQQLYEYIASRDLPFMTPVHGGGPTCSIVGNLLERGYGITPIADHFLATMSLEAVLPDGALYQSALAEMGAGRVDKLFKWGVGPYVDGLFTQGAFGIVTQATVALARRPEEIAIFLFSVRDEAHFPEAVVAVRRILRDLSGVVGSINLMNGERMVSMFCPYPTERTPLGKAVPEAVMRELMREHGIHPWTGLGALYGRKSIVRAARSLVKEALRHVAVEIRFMTASAFARLQPWVEWMRPRLSNTWSQRFSAVQSALQFLSGVPDERALKLAYWKSPERLPKNGYLDPARDGCGLMWYSPLVPMTPAESLQYVAQTREICIRHEIEPLITLTSLSERIFDSTVPILFQKGSEDEARANQCFNDLLQTNASAGFVPYRYSVKHMDRLRTCPNFLGLVESFRTPTQADHSCLAPGRYSRV
jgi:4-cresol dehydrogenase (hydroxylating)